MADAPFPLRRDAGTGTGTDSVGEMLLTIMGELLLPHGGEAWTQTVTGLLELFGVRDASARQALSRTAQRGWLDRERVGRQTRWRLTPTATSVLTTGADRIYSFGREDRRWDQRWLVVVASVPESDRRVRYRMGVGLSWEGFGSIGNGLWLTPWVDREAVAVSLLGELGVEATSFVAHLGQLGSADDLVRRAWDVPALRSAYDGFLTETVSRSGPSPTGGAAAAELVVHRWRRFPLIDPGLPAAVLPPNWPGPAAVVRFAEVRRSLLDEAHAWWRSTELANTPSRA